MTTTNLFKYTWMALLAGAFLVVSTLKAAADDTPVDWQDTLANQTVNINGGSDNDDITLTVDETSNDTTYTVKTTLGLAWIAKVTNEGLIKQETSPVNAPGTDTNAQYYPPKAGFEGCTIILDPTTPPATSPASYTFSKSGNEGTANTLDLSAYLWVPIGNTFMKPFKGTFDGNHKMITGLTVNVSVTTGSVMSATAFAGLFGRLDSNSKVSNLGIQVNAANNATNETGNTSTGEIEATSTTGISYAGALAGYSEGTIENCFVSGTGTICSKSTYSSGSASSGGLIGCNGETITHCYTTVNVVANSPSYSYAGGIIGDIIIGSTFQIKNVYATGEVEATSTTSNNNYAGGIVGNYEYGTLSNALALNKDGITGAINTNNEKCGVGRIIGLLPKDHESNLTACYASTKIRMNGKVKGESKYYDWQGNLSDAYHFIDGLTADTDTDLSALFPTTGEGAAWASGESGCLPILAGFTGITQPQTAIADYLDAPLDLAPAAISPQDNSTDGASYTLTYSDTDGWKYTKAEAIPATSNNDATPFSGRVKSTTEATADLTITNNSTATDDEATLSFADKTCWTAGSNKVALTISENSKPVALFSEGTVTIKAYSNSSNSLSVACGVTCRFTSDNHFHFYGTIPSNTGGTLQGLMEWRWDTALNTPSADISVFWTGGSTTIPCTTGNSYTYFATNPGGKDITVKLGDDYQKGKKNNEGTTLVSTFNFDDGTNNAYIYYTNMATGGTKGTKDNPYIVNLTSPSTDATGKGYTYDSDSDNNTITLNSPGSYYSLEGTATAGSILTLSADAANASTAPYHLLAAFGCQADTLKVPSATLCTIEGGNTLTATAAQVKGSLTLNAPMTLTKAVTTSQENNLLYADMSCLYIDGGNVTVNSTLRATATTESTEFNDNVSAIYVANTTPVGTLTITGNGKVYGYGTSYGYFYLRSSDTETLTIEEGGILRLASAKAAFYDMLGTCTRPLIQWGFAQAPTGPITVTAGSGTDYATFSPDEFGDNFTSAFYFATNVAANTDYTLWQSNRQLSGVPKYTSPIETTNFRTENGVSRYERVGKPIKNTNVDITITTQKKYKAGDGYEQDFNGIISNTAIQSLTVADQGISYLLLNGVTVSNAITVNENCSLYDLHLNNTNTIGSMTVETGGSIWIYDDGGGTLTIADNGVVTNRGKLIDYSGQITEVTGAAALKIIPPQDATAPTGQTITLTATAEAADGANVTEQWQKWDAKNNRWTDYPASPMLSSLQRRSATKTQPLTLNVTEEGTYRCQVTCKKTVENNSNSNGNNTVTTTLTTQPATATFTTSGGTPPPVVPVYYTVTLPAVEGATTDPVAGSYAVEDGYNFRFYLTLDTDYDQSTPVVTTDRGATIEPRSSDGAYIVKDVTRDTAIRIDGIVKNSSSVANETVAPDGTRVWTAASQLHIHTAAPTGIRIYTYSGSLLKQLAPFSGDRTIALPQGNYIVVAGDRVFKVQM
ncbi:hypothetical protein [uncultured Parabacteroides sp.]|uniref:hypothetical protein n=1 Tax=uncultured Parabacteroides sp. TaxID=512312 RepID=UPI0025E1D672|nr:hypothetical protein [uncultured Parabacteroides sp.]